MVRKPVNLTYGVEDKPPMTTSVMLGLQHSILLIGSVMAAIVFGIEAGLEVNQIKEVGTIVLLSSGLTTFLQTLPRGPIGSGYFCPHTSSFIYLQASVMAFKTGGLPLVFGMTTLSGFCEVCLSRLMRWLRPIFPTEVSGLVVTMVGVSLTPYAVRSIGGLGRGDLVSELPEIFVGLTTLALMIILNVWGKGSLRLFSVLIGICFGYGLSYLSGLVTTTQFQEISRQPFLALPSLRPLNLSFDSSFLLPFLIASICVSLKTIGDIVTCQKINDSDWKRTDMDSLGRGLTAEGLGSMASGLLGGLGLASNSSNIGLALASGATSRWIGYFTGVMFMMFAFFPKLAISLVLLPKPVLGAVTMFAACVMIVTGMNIIMTRMIDTRKIFVIGLSIISGLSVEAVPELYQGIPSGFKPIFGSTLALSTMMALSLNFAFRLGIASKAHLELSPGIHSNNEIYDFFEKMGSAWGARREVVYRAMAAVKEFHEAAINLGLSSGKVFVSARFDEFNLDVEIGYQGKEMCFPQVRPSEDEILKDDSALAKLSGFLINQMVNRIKTEAKGEQCRILLHFDH